MQKQFNLKAIFPVLILLGIVSACGKETLQDSINQDLDRGSATSNVVSKRYQAASGYYEGDGNPVIHDSFNRVNAPVHAKIQLHVEVYSKIVDGSLTPQPMLVGNFKMWMGNAVDPIIYTIERGSYSNGEMDLTIAGVGTAGPIVTCPNVKSGVLHCTWTPISGNVDEFSFDLHRTASGKKRN